MAMAAAHAWRDLECSPVDTPSGPADVNRARRPAPGADAKEAAAAGTGAPALTERMLAEERLWDVLRRRIVEIAEKRRVTLRDVAVRAGLPEGAVRDVVVGRSLNPRISTLMLIAESLNVSPAALLPDKAATAGGDVEVFHVRLLEPGGKAAAGDAPARSAVIALPPQLAPAARAGRLLAWQVTGEPQVAALQRGDLVVADTAQTGGTDRAPYLCELAHELRVVRVSTTLRPGERRLSVDDGDEPVTVPVDAVRILGRIVYLARLQIA
jgi:transcriptional regulator with XRE-family HTH domain